MLYMRRIAISLGGIVLVMLVGWLAYQQSQGAGVAPDENARTELIATSTVPATTTAVSEPVPVTNQAVADGISSLEVAKHSTRESCYAIISGNVYDLTSWIPQHPGGEQRILSICGTDGTAKFSRQHGGSAKPPLVLAGFKIGSLAP